MDEVKDVLVVGAGIGGLTAAIALLGIGVRVDMLEIRPEGTGLPGVGLSMQGNMLAALDRVGLARACIEAGMPSDHLNLRRPDGGLIAPQPLPPMGGPAYPATVGVARAALHEILRAEAVRRGARLRYGISVEAFESDDSGIDVRLTNGKEERYDLVVGADGLYSRLREKLFPDVRPVYCGQSVWRAAVPRPVECETSELHFGGRHGVVGLCPISANDAYVYVVESAPEGAFHPDDSAAPTLVERLQGYDSPILQQCIPHLLASGQATFRPLEGLLLDRTWYEGRVVLIGDAAHSGPPVLAQGAAMAVEDAIVLAEELKHPGAFGQRMQAFMARRLPRASLVVRNSIYLCEQEVNHTATPADVGRIMRETQEALSKPF